MNPQEYVTETYPCGFTIEHFFRARAKSQSLASVNLFALKGLYSPMLILPKDRDNVKFEFDTKNPVNFKFDTKNPVRFLSVVRAHPPKCDPEVIHHTTFTLSGVFHWAQTRWKPVDLKNLPNLNVTNLANFVEERLDPSFDHCSNADRAEIARELHRQTALWLQVHPSQAREVFE